MSVQRYYVLIVGGWKAADAVPEYYVTEAMETTTGVMVSIDPALSMARFRDLNLANEYAAWKNGTDAQLRPDPPTLPGYLMPHKDTVPPPMSNVTFSNCVFRPDWPFQVGEDTTNKCWNLYLHSRIDPKFRIRVERFKSLDGANARASKLNNDFFRDPDAVSAAAQRMADVATEVDSPTIPTPTKSTPEEEQSLEHPFHVERDINGSEWHLYMHSRINPKDTMRIQTFRKSEYGEGAVDQAMARMRGMNESFMEDSENTSKTAQAMARTLEANRKPDPAR